MSKVLLILLVAILSCKTIPVVERSDKNSASKLATKLPAPKLDYGVTSLSNGYKALYLTPQLSSPLVHHFRCDLCLVDGDNCRQLDLVWGRRLVVGLEAGKYNIMIRSCLLVDPLRNITKCGSPASYSYQQPKNDPRLDKIMQAQNQTLSQLDLEAQNLHHAAVKAVNKDQTNVKAAQLALVGQNVLQKAIKAKSLSSPASDATKKDNSKTPVKPDEHNIFVTKIYQNVNKTSITAPVLISIGSTLLLTTIIMEAALLSLPARIKDLSKNLKEEASVWSKKATDNFSQLHSAVAPVISGEFYEELTKQTTDRLAGLLSETTSYSPPLTKEVLFQHKITGVNEEKDFTRTVEILGKIIIDDDVPEGQLTKEQYERLPAKLKSQWIPPESYEVVYDTVLEPYVIKDSRGQPYKNNDGKVYIEKTTYDIIAERYPTQLTSVVHNKHAQVKAEYKQCYKDYLGSRAYHAIYYENPNQLGAIYQVVKSTNKHDGLDSLENFGGGGESGGEKGYKVIERFVYDSASKEKSNLYRANISLSPQESSSLSSYGSVGAVTIDSSNVISQASFKELSPYVQSYFELEGNSGYRLRELYRFEGQSSGAGAGAGADAGAKKIQLFVDKIEIGEQTLLLINPSMPNRFPSLNEDTLRHLAHKLTTDPENAGKGVVLVDTQGRLVEPPENWKTAENWFKKEGGTMFKRRDKGVLEVKDHLTGEKWKVRNASSETLEKDSSLALTPKGAKMMVGTGFNYAERQIKADERIFRLQAKVYEVTESVKKHGAQIDQDIRKGAERLLNGLEEKFTVKDKTESEAAKKIGGYHEGFEGGVNEFTKYSHLAAVSVGILGIGMVVAGELLHKKSSLAQATQIRGFEASVSKIAVNISKLRKKLVQQALTAQPSGSKPNDINWVWQL